MRIASARDGMYNGVFGGVFVFIPGVMLLALFDTTSQVEKVVVCVVLSLLLALMISLYLRTYYVVEAERLIIHFGPFRQTLARDRIVSIEPCRSIYSAPALSRDRLKIRFDHYGEVQISPREKSEFLIALGFPAAHQVGL